jgi:glycerol uptake facilitator-like aquaporin
MLGTGMFTMVFLSVDAGIGRIMIALWVLTVFCWKISGSHFNPAVSLAFMLRRDTSGLPRTVMLFYILF